MMPPRMEDENIQRALGRIEEAISGLKSQMLGLHSENKQTNARIESYEQRAADSRKTLHEKINTVKEAVTAIQTVCKDIPGHGERIDKLEGDADKRAGAAALKGTLIGGSGVIGAAGAVGGIWHWIIK